MQPVPRSASTTAAVLVPNVAACSSVIHVIDSLLLPSNNGSVIGGATSSFIDFLGALSTLSKSALLW